MIRLFFCSSVFLCLVFAQGYADEHFPFLGEASKESVHIRAGANINFESLGKLNKGGQVVVTGRHYEWYKVQLPAAASAYVRADYVKDTGNTTGTIMTDKVNVRARSNSESSSLGQMNKGDLVKPKKCMRKSPPGMMTLPHRSKCLTGFKVRRPRFLAVGSPNAQAAAPWASSCRTMAGMTAKMINKMTSTIG
ncbi:MAG TPA: SH3 domain-containing protein [Candidatus Omnitrophota bacterium]|nr:SH3 domain-containing protein [Candidatus Omnitrophota bacterium]